MIVLALLLAYAAAASDPCIGAPWPSLLVNCSPAAASHPLIPPGLDSYMRHEFGILVIERRPPVIPGASVFVDPGPGAF